jgi:cell division protein FtsW
LARLDSPLAAYYLVLGSMVALVVIGLVMVLSSSSIESFRKFHSAYSFFSNQALFAGIGGLELLRPAPAGCIGGRLDHGGRCAR